MAYTPPQWQPPKPPAWFDTNPGAINWGQLGPGYTGAPRAPGSANPTGRFNWETPGSYLDYSQVSNWDAARNLSNALGLYDAPKYGGYALPKTGLGGAVTQSLQDKIKTDGYQKYLDLADLDRSALAFTRGIDPQYISDNRIYIDSGRPGDAGRQNIDEIMQITGMSLDQLRSAPPEVLAASLDAMGRAREGKNQMPKRGVGNALSKVANIAGPLLSLFPPTAGIGAGINLVNSAYKGDPLGIATGVLSIPGVSNALFKNLPGGDTIKPGGVVPSGDGIPGGGFFNSGTFKNIMGAKNFADNVTGVASGVRNAGTGAPAPRIGTVATQPGTIAPQPGTVATQTGPIAPQPGTPQSGQNPGQNTGQSSADYLQYLANFASQISGAGAGGTGTGTGTGGSMPQMPTADGQITGVPQIPSAINSSPVTQSGAVAMTQAGVPGDPAFFGEMSRLLGDQPGMKHKTRPGAYYNALMPIQPRAA